MNSYEYLFDGEPVDVKVEKKGSNLTASVNGNDYEFEPVSENLYKVNIDGKRCLAAVVKNGNKYYIDIESVLLEIDEPSEDDFTGGGGGHAGEKDKIFAPMPGKIVKLLVAVGDEISEKQPMVIVEAMKMENQVNSKAKGIVKAINFADGDQVDTETPIIELELE